MSDYLLIVVAIAAVRIRVDQRSVLNYVVLGLSLASIYFSRVRGDALAVVVILVLVALPSVRRPSEGRLRLIGVLCIGALLVIPSIGGSRFTGAQGGSASTSVHIQELEHGLSQIGRHPLGLGLGSEPSDRQTLITTTSDTSENALLQVSDELGLQGLLPWLAFMIFVLLALRRRAKEGDIVASTMGFALVAILLAGMTHHVFLTLPVPWTLWAGTGLALSTFQETYRYPHTLATNPGLPVLGVP
jgi:O-antigen ligase